MKKLVLGSGLFFFCLLLPNASYANGQTILPMKVKIIGYEDTKRICAQRDYPSWCPHHLTGQNNDMKRYNNEKVLAKKSDGKLAHYK